MSRINFLNLVDSYNPKFIAPPSTPNDVKLFFVLESISRAEKRQTERELNKLILPLFNIEDIFVNSLFNEQIGNSYEELYMLCHNEFRNVVARLKTSKKLKMVSINERYFEQLYSAKRFLDLNTEVA